VPHLSCYCLTVEEKTALQHLIKTKKYSNISDKIGEAHFQLLIEHAGLSGFEQYEISNFAKQGFQSKHNSNYWKGVSYLGAGPSAHSFNGERRFWNVKNNSLYINSLLEDGKIPNEFEVLSNKDLYNEYVMTNLRTSWGCSLNKIETDFGNEVYTYILNNADKHIENSSLIIKENILYLTNQGKLYADKIAADLFLIEDINEGQH
jgi:oxygen-independent coproporphyrinogen-3 oxidase